MLNPAISRVMPNTSAAASTAMTKRRRRHRRSRSATRHMGATSPHRSECPAVISAQSATEGKEATRSIGSHAHHRQREGSLLSVG